MHEQPQAAVDGRCCDFAEGGLKNGLRLAISMIHSAVSAEPLDDQEP